MDPHFNEYLAAVAGMAEVYGLGTDEAHATSGDCENRETAEPLAAGV